jgi:hypothetical protein
VTGTVVVGRERRRESSRSVRPWTPVCYWFCDGSYRYVFASLWAVGCRRRGHSSGGGQPRSVVAPKGVLNFALRGTWM